jgi:lactoylglutathione lyase
VRLGYAIVYVSDMRRSVAFYRDVLGLPLRFESSQWTEFATDGATLALHAGEQPSSGAPGLNAGTCRPGLAVPDIDAFHARMTAHAVPCVQPPTDLHGVRLAQYRDPDGLVISVSGSPAR